WFTGRAISWERRATLSRKASAPGPTAGCSTRRWRTRHSTRATRGWWRLRCAAPSIRGRLTMRFCGSASSISIKKNTTARPSTCAAQPKLGPRRRRRTFTWASPRKATIDFRMLSAISLARCSWRPPTPAIGRTIWIFSAGWPKGWGAHFQRIASSASLSRERLGPRDKLIFGLWDAGSAQKADAQRTRAARRGDPSRQLRRRLLCYRYNFRPRVRCLFAVSVGARAERRNLADMPARLRPLSLGDLHCGRAPAGASAPVPFRRRPRAAQRDVPQQVSRHKQAAPSDLHRAEFRRAGGAEIRPAQLARTDAQVPRSRSAQAALGGIACRSPALAGTHRRPCVDARRHRWNRRSCGGRGARCADAARHAAAARRARRRVGADAHARDRRSDGCRDARWP